MKKYRKLLGHILIALLPLVIPVALVVIIDPYFHYHKPLEGFDHISGERRWINDGIIKHFDYETMLTGTSLDENVDFYYLEDVFHTDAIKTAYPGATIPEIAHAIRTACESNQDLQNVIMSLNFGVDINRDYDDWSQEGLMIPGFLYDKNLFNDWSYLLNFRILDRVLINIVHAFNHSNDTFDDYAKWEDYEYGKSAVLNAYDRPEKSEKTYYLGMQGLTKIKKNLDFNLVQLARDYPNVTFYYYLPPKSVIWWDGKSRDGTLDQVYEELSEICEELLQCDNIKLYYFVNETDVTTDLDNYKDPIHYGEWINNRMMKNMKDGADLVTEENYEQYIEETKEFYSNYDYDTLFQ